MLIELLSSNSYLQLNVKFIQVFGLRTAVYLSAAMNFMYSSRYNEDSYFELDRDQLFELTSLSFEEQISIEDKLTEAGILLRMEDIAAVSRVHITLDVNNLVNIIANGDSKLLDRVSKLTRLPKTLRAGRISNRQKQAMNLKYSIKAPNQELLDAYQNWVDGVYANPKGFLSQQSITIFQKTIDEYAKGDLDLALKLIEIATVNGYRDATWAINRFKRDYEKNWYKQYIIADNKNKREIDLDQSEVF